MTEYLNKSFSVGLAGDQQYRDNWERIFGKKEEAKEEEVADTERDPVYAKRPQPGEELEPEGDHNDCGGCEVCDRMFRRS